MARSLNGWRMCGALHAAALNPMSLRVRFVNTNNLSVELRTLAVPSTTKGGEGICFGIHRGVGECVVAARHSKTRVRSENVTLAWRDHHDFRDIFDVCDVLESPQRRLECSSSHVGVTLYRGTFRYNSLHSVTNLVGHLSFLVPLSMVQVCRLNERWHPFSLPNGLETLEVADLGP